MDARQERVISRIEEALVGMPSSFSVEVTREDLDFLGSDILSDYLNENGYRLDGTLNTNGQVTLFGSSREVQYA